jgi:hypothetical protein
MVVLGRRAETRPWRAGFADRSGGGVRPDPTSVLSAAIGAPNISLDQSYHYLPELLEILTEAIPSLFKSKQKWWEKKQLNYAYSREKLRAVSGMACRAAALSNRQPVGLVEGIRNALS